MSSTARRAAALICASALLAACSGNSDDRSRGDEPVTVSAAETTPEPAPSTTPEPTTPEPTGPASADELSAALAALPNVTGSGPSWAGIDVTMDAWNADTVLAAFQLADDAGQWWEDAHIAIMMTGPTLESGDFDFMAQISGLSDVPTAEQMAAVTSIVDSTEITTVSYALDRWIITSTYNAAAGTDWYPGFLATVDAIRAQEGALAMDDTATVVSVEFDRPLAGSVDVPISAGDSLQNAAWKDVIERISDAKEQMLFGEPNPGLSYCSVSVGPIVSCTVADTSLETTSPEVRTAIENLQAAAEAAGVPFELQESLF